MCRTNDNPGKATQFPDSEQCRNQGSDLLENLARLVPGVIYQYRLDPDGHSAFPYASPGMYDIYEVTPEEVREDASPVFGRLHPDDQARVVDAIYASARTLETFYCEYRVILPKQGLRWRWSQAHPERLAGGGTLWHGIISDITDRKRMEETLRESEETHRLLIENLPDIVMRFDRAGRHLYVSANVRDMVDLEAERFLGKTHRELGFPEDKCRFWEEVFNRVFSTGAPFETEYNFDGRTGHVIHNLRLVPERNSQGVVNSVLSISRDITAHRQTDEALKEKYAELERFNRVTLGREARMIELKNEVNVLLKAAGQPAKYRIVHAPE